MKSADGFKKNEAINMVSQRYYIKVTGEDAPVNMAPNIKLGMNVAHIAWFSTTGDAAIFPEEIVQLTGEQQAGAQKGISLQAILEEVGLFDLEEKQFEVIGTDGNSVKVSGQELNKDLLRTADRHILDMAKEDAVDVCCRFLFGVPYQRQPSRANPVRQLEVVTVI